MRHPQSDRQRSIPFERLVPLIGADAQWIALQNAIRPTDQSAFDRCGRVSFHGEALKDFSDTAALVDLVDIVVSVGIDSPDQLYELAGSGAVVPAGFVEVLADEMYGHL